TREHRPHRHQTPRAGLRDAHLPNTGTVTAARRRRATVRIDPRPPVAGISHASSAPPTGSCLSRPWWLLPLSSPLFPWGVGGGKVALRSRRAAAGLLPAPPRSHASSAAADLSPALGAVCSNSSGDRAPVHSGSREWVQYASMVAASGTHGPWFQALRR